MFYVTSVGGFCFFNCFPDTFFLCIKDGPRIEMIGCNEIQLLHDHCRPEWRAHRLLSARCSQFWNLVQQVGKGEEGSGLVWMNMFILFIHYPKDPINSSARYLGSITILRRWLD